MRRCRMELISHDHACSFFAVMGELLLLAGFMILFSYYTERRITNDTLLNREQALVIVVRMVENLGK